MLRVVPLGHIMAGEGFDIEVHGRPKVPADLGACIGGAGIARVKAIGMQHLI